MNQDKELRKLFDNYLAGRSSPEELRHLLDYFQKHEDGETLRSLILNELEDEEKNNHLTEKQQVIVSRVSIALESRIQMKKAKLRRLYLTWGAAAAVLLISGVWLGLRGTLDMARIQTEQTAAAILPGEDKAILVMEDGSTVALDNNTKIDGKDKFIFKDSSGMMTFDVAGLPAYDLKKSRTVSTPKGGQFALVLTDGTKVWLNAESSITFPNNFDQNTRDVSIEGEAYFEVAPNTSKPFLVSVRQQTVKVLGTHFNINAYPENRAVVTGLLEGSVAVSAGGREVKLQPGQMSFWEQTKNGIRVEEASDIESLISWKEGIFSFTKSSINEIMQNISRWYDVDVAFSEGDFSNYVFDGMISKKESIQQVLSILSVSKELAFEIKGKKVIVSQLKNKN